MSDLISREQAIEAVKHSTAYMHDDLYEAISIRIPSAETTGALDDAIAKYVADGLMELPSAEAGWIPVSERLPEKDGLYLVTCPLLGGGMEVLTAWYGTPLMPISPVKGKCFFDSDDEWGDVPYDDVLAWMPLPKPYKGGDTE